MEEKEFNFAELILLGWKGRFVILVCVALSFCISVGITFFMPNLYESTSKLVSRRAERESSTNLAGLAALAGLSLKSGASADPATYLMEIIRDSDFVRKILEKRLTIGDGTLSLRDIRNQVEAGGKVKQHLGPITPQEIESFRNGNHIGLSRDEVTGVITLTTRWSDPVIAYQLNCFAIEFLDNYVKTMLKTQARENRLFVEQRIIEIRRELDASENALTSFREKNRLSVAPKLLLEEQRLQRNVSISQELYLQMRQQYEIARIDEKKDQPLLEVIRKPEPPLYRLKPRKKSFAVGGIVFGFFGSLFFLLAKRTFKFDSRNKVIQ